ncbi:MAG: hypothetical protein N2Z81_07665 [Hydrogenothermaceae bacterium]|nr:hypothetical protein [Hydrogenothermaceae bacterium]
MVFRAVLMLLVLANTFSFAKDKSIYIVAQTNPKTEDYSWIERYFLVESLNVYDLVMLKKNELELTEKQINDINSEYNKIFPIMLGKARIVKDKEEELRNLVIKTNDSQKIKDLLIDIAKLKTELSVLDINLFKTIQSILNKKQNEKLNSYLLKNTY